MTVISSREFAANQKRYFDLALNEQVYVKRGDYMFHITCSNYETVNKKQKVLEPDDDLRRAIPLEEVRDRVIDYIRRKHANQT